MCQLVNLEVTICCASVLTLLATERFFSGMNKNVLFQITSCCEREGTHGAFVRFFSSILCLGFGVLDVKGIILSSVEYQLAFF